ncbi:hypothetical protein M413DRAFT_317365 [Hebeloma cylindrosporum]|uniref:Uncharacterized protein n=1 Tax=Hebeloma cylindrosporum TaxID=76867 RepID=A0A0C2YZY0_HEBCY|nr:hypothetical protein M413DRAFT_317365 [Hebeloma cylindrosporum h7]
MLAHGTLTKASLSNEYVHFNMLKTPNYSGEARVSLHESSRQHACGNGGRSGEVKSNSSAEVAPPTAS